MSDPLSPLVFRPIFKERIWGGQLIADRYGKAADRDRPMGESWEICDRPGESSVVAHGPLEGRTLHTLMEERGKEILGRERDRFPLLVKILDARERLSLQVHPPASVAARLGGEPKTEMWYMAECAPGAELHVGLTAGATREIFEERLRSGTVAECFHRIGVRSGDAMFLPSGRVHAIGSGNLVFEIQENSDTTYRVFDWNRKGLDGQLRELHQAESLQCIDFADIEPSLVQVPWRSLGPGERRRTLADCSSFRVEQLVLEGDLCLPAGTGARVAGVISGKTICRGNGAAIPLGAGEFALLPHALTTILSAPDGAECLLARIR